jgi:integrase
VLDRWVEPYLGQVRLRDLGPGHVREWRSRIVEAGAPPTQANHALAVLSAVLGCAARDGLLPANPCLGVRKLSVLVARPRALTPVEVERIRAHMPTVRDVVIVGLLAYAGLRPEEAFALSWDSITRHVIVVDRAYTYGEMKATKTHLRRVVDVVAPLDADVAVHRPHVTEPGELVVQSATGLPIDLRLRRRRVWKSAAKSAGVTATPYDLRHTYCSLLAHEGRAAVYIAAMMGHSTTRMQDRYSHVIADAHMSPLLPMADAISQARQALERGGLHSRCTQDAPAVLRRSL